MDFYLTCIAFGGGGGKTKKSPSKRRDLRTFESYRVSILRNFIGPENHFVDLRSTTKFSPMANSAVEKPRT